MRDRAVQRREWLEVGASWKWRELLRLKLSGNVAGRQQGSVGPRMAALQLRARQLSDIGPGPRNIERLDLLFERLLRTGPCKDPLRSPKHYARDGEEPQDGPSTGVEATLLNEPLQAVAQEVEAQDREKERQGRQGGQPGDGAEGSPGGPEHGAPIRRLEDDSAGGPHIAGDDPPTPKKDAHEPQLSQEEQRSAHFERRQRQHRRQQVRHDVPAEDLERAQAHRSRRLHELFLLHGEHVAADDLGNFSPAHNRKGDHEGDLPAPDADRKDDNHGQNERRQRRQQLTERIDCPIEDAAGPPARQRSQDQSKEQPYRSGDDGERQRRSGSVEKQREHVATLRIRPERVLRSGLDGRALQFSVDVLQGVAQIGVARRNFGADHRHQDEAGNHDRAENEGGVLCGAPQTSPQRSPAHAVAPCMALSLGSMRAYEKSSAIFASVKSTARGMAMTTTRRISPA